MNKISILIIDDNEADRYLLKRQLMDINIDVHIFEKDDGRSALDFFNEHEKHRALHPEVFPPIIIFLDINMPLVSGAEFLQEFSEIRQKIGVESCIVVMFTSSERQEDMDNVLSFDFVKDYLVKGQFTDEELEEKIENLLAAA